MTLTTRVALLSMATNHPAYLGSPHPICPMERGGQLSAARQTQESRADSGRGVNSLSSFPLSL